ncbi:MAG: cytochrome c oxidase assembly protein [Alphaproteobacteria bacterium]|nr:cytochrome c oxidase assembly protein [Alphaproteobacteria bacterium]
MSAATRRSNGRVALGLAGLVATMGALSFAAVPLYRWICQVTGFGGTTMRAERAPDRVGDLQVTVRFNADIGGNDLPWRFETLERKVVLRVGEERLAFYRATNIGNVPVVGTATYNVTPHKAAPYFHKLACFCFTEQELAPGESLDMPVSFFVDPAIADDPKMRGIDTITLSYTFFRALDAQPSGAGGRTAAAGPAPVN